MSDLLWQLLDQHRDLNTLCDRLCSCGIQHPIGHVYHLTELISAEFLVVPRSDIVGTEYAYRHAPDMPVFRGTGSADAATQRAAKVREAQQRRGWVPRAEALERPVLVWKPITPASEVPDGA